MKTKKSIKTIIEYILIAIVVAIIVTAVVFATGAIFNAQFALDVEIFVQKEYAYYDFDIVKFSTIVAFVLATLLIIYLVIRDNKTKIKKKKIVRR